MRALLWASTVGVTGAVVADPLKKDHILTHALIELNKQIVEIEQDIRAQRAAEETLHNKFDAHASKVIAAQNELIRGNIVEKTSAESDAAREHADADAAKLDSEDADREAQARDIDITALKNAEKSRTATFEKNEEDLKYAVAEVEKAIELISRTTKEINRSYDTSVHDDSVQDMDAWKTAQKAEALLLVQKHMSKSAFMALKQDPIYVSGEGGGGWQSVTILLSDLKHEFDADLRVKDMANLKETAAYEKQLGLLTGALDAAEARAKKRLDDSGAHQTVGDQRKTDAGQKQKLIEAAEKVRDDLIEQQKESFKQYTTNRGMMDSDLDGIEDVKTELEKLGTTQYDDKTFGSSFVQLASTNSPSVKVLEAKQFLQKEALHLHSKLLAQIAESSDVFARVKQLISDLITRLTTQANQEKSEQDVCITKITEADGNLNQAKAILETARVAVEEANDDVVTYTHATNLAAEEVGEYETAIQTLTTDYKEARATKKENERLSKVTASSLRAARKALMEIPTVSLLQTGSHANAEPPALANQYTSRVGSIMGMVNSLIEQFEAYEEKMGLEIVQDEKAFDESFDLLGAAKEKAVTDKAVATTNLGTANSAKTTAEANVGTSSDQLTASQSAWDATQKECVHAASYKDRVAKREAEIASLKEALAILNSS